MKRGLRWAGTSGLLIALLLGSGCVYTTAGTKLGPVTPPQPASKPIVEYTVGDFSFTLEGGKMVTSNYVGRLLIAGILDEWKNRGYIAEARYVEAGAFTPDAEYQLTLSGSQYGESSIVMQVLSGLTLTLIPYTVTQQYDLQVALVDAKTGAKHSAAVRESNKSYVELFLLFALPVSIHNQHELNARMGDHLYSQLVGRGAFAGGDASP